MAALHCLPSSTCSSKTLANIQTALLSDWQSQPKTYRCLLMSALFTVQSESSLAKVSNPNEILCYLTWI